MREKAIFNAYVAIMATIEMAHVRNIDLESTLYFSARKVDIRAHTRVDNSVPDFLRDIE